LNAENPGLFLGFFTSIFIKEIPLERVSLKVSRYDGYKFGEGLSANCGFLKEVLQKSENWPKFQVDSHLEYFKVSLRVIPFLKSTFQFSMN
jgi:hypothetical protein